MYPSPILLAKKKRRFS